MISANSQPSIFKQFLFIYTQLGAPMLNQQPISFADLKDLCKDNSNHQQYRLRYVKCCRDGFDFSEIHYQEIDVLSLINNSNTCECFYTPLLKPLIWSGKPIYFQPLGVRTAFPSPK